VKISFRYEKIEKQIAKKIIEKVRSVLELTSNIITLIPTIMSEISPRINIGNLTFMLNARCVC